MRFKINLLSNKEKIKREGVSEMKQDFIENKLIIITKQTSDLFLMQKNPADLLALYWFYYYTAKWQKTNITKCSINYVEKGLNWSKEKVIKTKKGLIALDLIKNIKRKNKKGQITGWYIKIKYIWGKKKSATIQRVASPEGGFNQRVENPDTNALSSSNINALNSNKEMLSKPSVCGKNVNSLIELFKPVNPSYKRLYSNTTERKALQRLIDQIGEEKLINTLKVLPEITAKKYAPRISTPLQLERKLGDLIIFYKQEQNSKFKVGIV